RRHPSTRLFPYTTLFRSEVMADVLPGGPVATTMHVGPYEQLSDAYAAIEQWIEAERLAKSGAPWECYINDPSEHPDPKDWKTERSEEHTSELQSRGHLVC